jgi:SAM-dependent methyltransferase
MKRIEPFNRHTSLYEEWFVKNHFAYESELEAIAQLLPKKGRALEIGVGSGRFAASLNLELGIEPSKEMSELARKRGIEVVGAVGEWLPFRKECFDCILMVTTICFLENVEKALKEVHKIIDRNSLIGRIYEHYKQESVFYRVATFYSVDDIMNSLRAAGFVDYKFKQTIFHPLPEITNLEPVKNGYGDGSFVAIKGTKMNRL